MTAKYWKECYSVDLKDKTDLDSLSNVDVYYEKWVQNPQKIQIFGNYVKH